MHEEIQAIVSYAAVEMQGSRSVSAKTTEASKDQQLFASEDGGTAAAVQALARVSTTNVHLLRWADETMEETDDPVVIESLLVWM